MGNTIKLKAKKKIYMTNRTKDQEIRQVGPSNVKSKPTSLLALKQRRKLHLGGRGKGPEGV